MPMPMRGHSSNRGASGAVGRPAGIIRIRGGLQQPEPAAVTRRQGGDEPPRAPRLERRDGKESRVINWSAVVVYGAIVGCIYALAALGLVVVYKATRVLNFAQGAIGMFATFVFFY